MIKGDLLWKDPFDAVHTSNTLIGLTLFCYIFNTLAYPRKCPQHNPLGMVQHFMNHARKQQFFLFCQIKMGEQKILSFLVLRVGAVNIGYHVH